MDNRQLTNWFLGFISAEVFMAKANFSTYLHHAVGVAEHPNTVESMDNIVCKLAEAEDKLNIIKKYRGIL